METLERLAVWADDSELIRRAAAPPREWYPSANRATALQPLVWLIGLLPIIIASIRMPWSNDAAQLGLRSLKLMATSDWTGLFLASQFDNAEPLLLQPPLMTWLTAIGMTIFGPDHAWGVLLISCLCTYCIVIVSLLLARDLGGPWQSVLTCLFVATHPWMPFLAIQPSSSTLALTSSLLALWTFYRHSEGRTHFWSKWMWGSTLALSGMLLSDGAIAVVTAMILFTYSLFVPRLESSARRIAPLPKRSSRSGWRAAKSYLIWLVAGSLLGGWWIGLMAVRHQFDICIPWLGLKPDLVSPVSTEEAPWNDLQHWFRNTAVLLPLMSGFVILGLCRLLRIVIRDSGSIQHRSHVFLLIWFIYSVVGWCLSMWRIEGFTFNRGVWAVNLIVPVSLLAAEGFTEIGERRAGFLSVLTVFVFGVVVLIARFRSLLLDPTQIEQQVLLGAVVVIVTGFLSWIAYRFVLGHEVRQTWLVKGGTWTLILTHCLWGITGISHRQLAESAENEYALLQFWRDLREWKVAHPLRPDAPGEVILMTQADPIERLQYVVQSLWPRREFHQVENWESMSRWIPATGPRLLVVYGERQMLRPSSPGDSSTLAPIVPPRIYRNGELSAYEWKK